MSLKTFYLEHFRFIPIISYKITSGEQNENTNIMHLYSSKTKNTIMNSQLTEDKLVFIIPSQGSFSFVSRLLKSQT